MPLIYYVLVTGGDHSASFLPWSEHLRSLVAGNLFAADSIALGVAVVGLIISGASVLFVRAKTLVVGGKKTLVFFTLLFLIISIMLVFRVFHLAQPYLANFAHKNA